MQGKLYLEVIMLKRVSVLILGEDCGHDAVNDWHKVTQYTKEQLENKYPGKVDVAYMTIHDALNNYHSAPAIGPNNQAPIVFVDEDMISQGKKIDIHVLAEEIEKRIH